MAIVEIPEDQPVEATVGAPTFVTSIDGITEARALELDADAVSQAKAYTDTAIAGIDFPEPTELDWDLISDKPTTFPPSAHDHSLAQLPEVQTALNQKANAQAVSDALATKADNQAVNTALAGKSDTGHKHTFDSITDRPTAYPPSTHQHSADDITSGVFDAARLGTGTADASKVLGGDGTWIAKPIDGTPGPAGPQGASGMPNTDLVGTGMPNGVVTAAPGTIYRDTAGTNGAWLWIKKSGTNQNGWAVLDGDTGWRNITSVAIPAGQITGGKLRARRVNSEVMFEFADLQCGGVTGTQYPDWAIPVGFRPALGNPGLLYALSGGTVASTFVRFDLAASGGIFRMAGGITANTRIREQKTWPSGTTGGEIWPTGALPGTPD